MIHPQDPRMATLPCAFALLTLTLASCGTSEPPAAAAPTWHTDIRPIVESHCLDCHKKGGVAPIELATREQVVALKSAILTDLHSRRMPPFAADSTVRKYRFDDSLTPAQVKRFEDWFAAGAPEGSPTAKGTPIKLERPAMSRVDLTIKVPHVYKPKGNPDDYRCFPVEWKHTTAKYVTAFGVTPGNAKIAHHAILFAISAGQGAEVDKFDNDDPGDGYACYGAPNPPGAQINPTFVGEWAPGTQGVDYPAGTGIKIEPGTRLVLQMHYNVSADPQGTDQTAVHLALADKVEREAWFLPWFNLQWFADPMTMKIAAGDAKAQHAYEEVPTKADVATLTLPGVDLAAGFQVHAVLPHMHTRGRKLDLTTLHGDGKTETMLRIVNWDFNWQRLYFLAEPAKVAKGEKVRVQCQWDNSDAGQPVVDGKKLPAKDLGWGEGTYDEMCIAFMYVTQK